MSFIITIINGKIIYVKLTPEKMELKKMLREVLMREVCVSRDVRWTCCLHSLQKFTCTFTK